jgi:hypothetical protein
LISSTECNDETFENFLGLENNTIINLWWTFLCKNKNNTIINLWWTFLCKLSWNLSIVDFLDFIFIYSLLSYIKLYIIRGFILFLCWSVSLKICYCFLMNWHFFFMVLGFELRAYTLRHCTSHFFVKGLLR